MDLEAIKAEINSVRETRFPDATLIRWATALDNYEPVPRAYASGYGYTYTREDGQRAVKFWPDGVRDAQRATYVFDTGTAVWPGYAAGWQSMGDGSATMRPDGYVVAHEYPHNPDGRTRPDNGRVIDFDNWMLGPRRSYHVKITPVPAGI